MSDHYQMLVDADAQPASAGEVVQLIIARFRDLGLIAGDPDEECVLSGVGYHPGPAIADFYKPGKREARFWELVTCGVQAESGRSFNEWALGPACEGIACPSCETHFEPFDDAFGEGLMQAVGEWMDESGPALVACPQCRKEISITQWKCTPPLGFGNVSFRFWNWPPFDAPGWKIDVAGIVREVTTHNIVWTYGGF